MLGGSSFSRKEINSLSVWAREAERYVPRQLAVLDQSDSCCLEQWEGLGRAWMSWEVEEDV